MRIAKKDIKVNDVFRARWKERTWNDQKDHCFEGLLLALDDGKGNLGFYDTYWGIGDKAGRSYNFERMNELFKIEHYCNLDELKEVANPDYYNDEDVYWLHRQHACARSCVYNFVKKGAQKSQEKIMSVLREKIKTSKRKIESLISDIERDTEYLKQAEDGNLDVYL